MEVKYEVKVTGVGKDARDFLDNNSSIILLDEDKHQNLADMVVMHTVGSRRISKSATNSNSAIPISK